VKLRKYAVFNARMAKLADLPAGRQACLPTGRRASFRRAGVLWYVYAIRSLVRSYIYVGLTSNIEDRVARHNGGRERTTRAYRPFELLWIEEFETRVDARKQEKYLKSGSGKEFLKSKISDTDNQCPDGEIGRRASFRS
jgi:putative endonuclease